jgi:hypothetical protein
MKLLLPACLLLGLLTTATSCRKNDEAPASASCPGAGDEVKTAAAVRGVVRQSPLTHEYAIATYPSITNGFDVGVLCTALPASLQVDGTKVIFSGTYRRKPGEGTAGDVATYYLSLSSVSLDLNP